MFNSHNLEPLQMNAALANALDALRSSGAKQMPTTYDVLLAPNGSTWEGAKVDGSYWKLIKHGTESYNVTC